MEKPYKHCVDGCRFIVGGQCRFYELHVPTVAVDFDRTLFHHIDWEGHEQCGEPIPGARDAVLELRKMGFTIVVWTTRNQPDIVTAAMKKYDIPFDYINENPNQPPDANPNKLTADFYIDDRAVRFTNWPYVLAEIRTRLKTDPYYRQGTT